jgi:glucose dehydrogenase
LELARRGIAVAVLESGPRHDFPNRGQYVRRYLNHENPWATSPPELDRHTVGGQVFYRLDGRRVRGVGGSTLHWEGYTLRFHASDFRLRSLYGIAADWPISYDEIEPYYGLAEAGLGVAGLADDPWASPRTTSFPLPPFPLSHTDTIFQRAAREAGVTLHHLPQARNSQAYGGRSICRACATCFVCPTGAKASTDLTHLSEAEATGKVQLLTEATVLALELDAEGQVASAVFARRDRSERRLQARVFVVAAGAVENARLLLLSTSPRFPTGLANTSGLVGKGFMSHASIDVIGRTSKNVYPHRIGFSTAISRQFATGHHRRDRAAFLLEFLNSAGPTPEQIAAASGRFGEDLRRHVEREFGHWIGIRVYAEQLPDPLNAVSINRRALDYFGQPGPHIFYRVGAYERRALDEARSVAGKLLQGVGASEIKATPLSFAAHQIGTHRMGSDPGTSVVDANLRTHDVANMYLVGSGCFVTASASPPTLTIVALAIRAARHIAAQLRPVS